MGEEGVICLYRTPTDTASPNASSVITFSIGSTACSHVFAFRSIRRNTLSPSPMSRFKGRADDGGLFTDKRVTVRVSRPVL